MLPFFNLTEKNSSARNGFNVLLPCFIFLVYLFCAQPLASSAENETVEQPSQTVPSSVAPAQKPLLLPPDPPDRTRLPQVLAQPSVPASLVRAKAALSWRQKTLKLSSEKFKSGAEQKTANPLLRSFDAIYPDILMALNSSCSDCGFHVDSLNSSAGEILASNQDAQIKLVFSVWEQPLGKCWIYSGVEKGNSTVASKAASTILDTVFNTISKRGRI